MNTDYVDREQTEIKHYALRKYLEAAALILGSSRNLAYTDCCAGPWESKAADYSDTSFGIATTALTSGLSALRNRGISTSSKALFIEEKTDSYLALKKFVDEHTSDNLPLRAENWDFSQHMAAIVNFASGNRNFSFTFIDPTGWKLASIPMITPLLQISPGEVLINLMSPFITRFINDSTSDFTDLIGADFAEVRQLDTQDQEDSIVSRYCEAVRQVGKFKYVCALPIMKPDVDAFNFHLIYATRNQKGIKVFKEVEQKTELMTHVVRAEVQKRKRQERSGTLDMFAPEVLYREQRYQRLSLKNKALAKDGVRRLIQDQTNITYDDCWGHALQFAAVYEADIRSWLLAWESEQRISISGRKFPKEVLKFGAQQMISLTNGWDE